MVSVVVPSYNREMFIGDVLDCLKKQTCKDIEVIVIDDGSLDNTGSVVKAWEARNLNTFKRLIYLKLPRNCEEEWAYNTGFSLASGEYYAIQNSDDLCHEERIQKQVEYLATHPEVAVAGCSYKAFTNDVNKYFYEADWLCFDSQKIIENYTKTLVHCVCTGTFLLRPEVFKKIIGFRKIAYGVNDVFFANDIVDNGFSIYNSREALYYVRSHPGQKSNYLSDKDYLNKKTGRIKDRVSIVYPVHAKSESLTASLDSIAGQSYGNMELVVVDDSLQDATEVMIRDWYGRYCSNTDSFNIKELVYLKLPKNVEGLWLYNIGAYLAKGEYIAFHGLSGVSSAERIRMQAEFLKSNPEYGAVAANITGNAAGICIDTWMLHYSAIDKTAGFNPYSGENAGFELMGRLLENKYLIKNMNDKLYFEI